MLNGRKSRVLLIVLSIVILGIVGQVFASPVIEEVTAYINHDIKINLVGPGLSPVDPSVKPVTYKGQTYLPVRAISTGLGLDVDWNADTQTVTVSKEYDLDSTLFPSAEIWLDKDNAVHRTGIQNDNGGALCWVVLHNGKEVLQRNARNETEYKYFRSDSGVYTIYVTQFVDGRYRVISNVVSYQEP